MNAPVNVVLIYNNGLGGSRQVNRRCANLDHARNLCRKAILPEFVMKRVYLGNGRWSKDERRVRNNLARVIVRPTDREVEWHWNKGSGWVEVVQRPEINEKERA